MNELHYLDAYCLQTGERLIFGNAAFRREIDLSGGFPRTVSLRDGAGHEFAAADRTDCDSHFVGINPPGYQESCYRIRDCSARRVDSKHFDAPHLAVKLTFGDDIQQAVFVSEYFIYPGLATHAVRNRICSEVMPNCYWSSRNALRGPGNTTRFPAFFLESAADSLALAPGQEPVEAVEFAGRTDYTDDLVVRHPADREATRYCGNLFRVADAAGRGLEYLQEAPPSAERRDLEDYDFRLEDRTLYSCCWGIPPQELRPGKWFTGYRHALTVYHTPEELAKARIDYLARRFPMRRNEMSAMVNPWGCGRFPQLTGEEFLLREIEAAGQCGADSYQIDDSWQEGGSLAELSNRNRRMTMDFWKISAARLHGSFGRLAAAAQACGVRLALWCAPSANAEYRDWREFAAMVLDYHREYGFDMFKIDGVLTRTYEAEENLEKLLRKVRRDSDGAVYFNLDTTNGQRPGYFRMLEYGNIFLENRYCCHTWSLGYHPEKTLRSFWQLAQFMRAQSLQIEIPAPEEINPELYALRQRSLPDTYSLEYWCAIALFANPLLWFAPSTVGANTRETVRRMLDLRREHADALFRSRIYPAGGEPDGRSITGFYADAGYVMAFREAEAPATTALLTGHFTPPATGRIVRLGGSGELRIGPSGLEVTLPERASYGFFRIF